MESDEIMCDGLIRDETRRDERIYDEIRRNKMR